MMTLAVDNLAAEPGRADAPARHARGSGAEDTFDRAFAAAREQAEASGDPAPGESMGREAEPTGDEAPREGNASAGDAGGVGEPGAAEDPTATEADATDAVAGATAEPARGGETAGEEPERPGSSRAAQPRTAPRAAADAPPAQDQRQAAYRDARQGQSPASPATARPGDDPGSTAAAPYHAQAAGEQRIAAGFGEVGDASRPHTADDAGEGTHVRGGSSDETADGAPQRPPGLPPILRPVAAEGGAPQNPQGPSPAPTPAQFQMPTGAPASATIEPPPPAPAQAPGASAATAAEATDAESVTRLGEGDPQRVAEQALRALRSGINQRGGTVTLQLNPPELGTLKVRLDMSNNIVRASFEAATDAARSLLQGQLTGLRTALEAHGLTVENLQVQTQSAQPANHHGFARGEGEADDGRSRGSFDQHRSDEPHHEDDPGNDNDPRSAFERELLDLIA